MKLMLEYLTNLQKDKIGKCNSVEEFSFKINHLKLEEEQELEDNPIKRSLQDLGRYEGKYFYTKILSPSCDKKFDIPTCPESQLLEWKLNGFSSILHENSQHSACPFIQE